MAEEREENVPRKKHPNEIKYEMIGHWSMYFLTGLENTLSKFENLDGKKQTYSTSHHSKD